MQPAGAAPVGSGGPFVGPYVAGAATAYAFRLRAANPTAPTGYTPQPASQVSCPTPSGGTGRASNPITNADWATGVSSLSPQTLGWGQAVPLEVQIPVTGDTSAENGTIQFKVNLATKTTSGDNFGFDPSLGVYCAFVDSGDTSTTDPGNNAKVDSFGFTVINPRTPASRFRPRSKYLA